MPARPPKGKNCDIGLLEELVVEVEPALEVLASDDLDDDDVPAEEAALEVGFCMSMNIFMDGKPASRLGLKPSGFKAEGGKPKFCDDGD